MDSNDSFSLAMDTPDMPGYVPGLAPGGPHGHGPLPHHGPGLYPDHYDQAGPGLPPHPVFTGCGQFMLIRKSILSLHFQVVWMIQVNTIHRHLTPG